MARKKDPAYRRQPDPKGDRAFVELNGQRIYLGPFDSGESRREYHRVLAEWKGAGRASAAAGDEEDRRDSITVIELIADFWDFAQEYYRQPDGTPGKELAHYERVLRPLKELYGETLVRDFGPLRLKAVRQRFVDQGGCRSYVNHNVNRLRRVFKWAVAEEKIRPEVYSALQLVEGLKRGRAKVRESQPVRPVPQDDIEAIRPLVARQVMALVDLQLLTAARPGELIIMRPCDIDASRPVWIYTPEHHKTEHRGHERRIFIGPRAREILKPFLKDRALGAFVFSPQEAEDERRAAMHARRKTPLSMGNSPGTNKSRNPKRPPKDRYSVESYGRAIARACQKAKIDPWHPHQLRHSAGTHLRREFGLEVAQVILGHKTLGATQVYAERDVAKALDVMSRIG